MPEGLPHGLETVEIAAVEAPGGRCLLLQLSNGFVLLSPQDARRVAATLTEVSLDVERLRG